MGKDYLISKDNAKEMQRRSVVARKENAVTRRTIREAVEKALNVPAKGKDGKVLRDENGDVITIKDYIFGNRLVKMASEGDLGAIKELAELLEGNNVNLTFFKGHKTVNMLGDDTERDR